ncbi:MAG: antibiotic biosynthesis monooxygenase [Gammaproteobacteria bacterium]|nr:antibiotic biosynthesis monooxygenase [Gammaproteobacteria bacterium]
MTTILIKHPVQDYTIWKGAFDSFIDTRKASGEKSYHICRPIDEPNNVVILFEWDSLDKAKAFLDSEDLKAAMQQAGVTGPPEITLMETTAKGDT